MGTGPIIQVAVLPISIIIHLGLNREAHGFVKDWGVTRSSVSSGVVLKDMERIVSWGKYSYAGFQEIEKGAHGSMKD